MNKEVFVSYASLDKKIAHDLVAYLENKNINCFIAPRDVDPGMPYASNLMHAIDHCNVIILIASNAMNKSEHVLNEVDVITAKKKTLIPFFIEDFEMNDDFRYYLGRTQRIIAYPEMTSSYYSKLYNSLVQILSKNNPNVKDMSEQTTNISISNNNTTIFEYIPERGIMINPEDFQRNVSFRTDTFINMFGGIFESIVEIAGIEKAKEVFRFSGYVSEQNFAQRLNSRWDSEQTSSSFYEKKLKKWCEFDSNVGWGKFNIRININEDTGDLDGELTINECFIVDKKKRKKVCEFIRGYCEGVIETLLCVHVKLSCTTCPLQNRFKSKCIFKISLDEI